MVTLAIASLWLFFSQFLIEMKLIGNIMYSVLVAPFFEGTLNEPKHTLSGEQAGYLPMPVLSLYVVVMIQCPAEHSPHTVL